MAPLITSFYSYKGGTGRTTATANIASFASKAGLKVVCIDMDIEGPGLSVLFNIPESKVKGVQYILEGEPIIEVEDYIVPLNSIVQNDIANNIYVIPASTQFNRSLDFSDGSKSIRKIKDFIEVVNQKLNPDLIILDTPSGYGHLSALSIYLSQLLVVFFRWSRQHLLGTVKIREFAKENELDLLTVASCVPDEKGQEERKEKYNKIIQPDFEIKDDNELKWVERIVLFEQGSSEEYASYPGYSAIADKIKSKI